MGGDDDGSGSGSKEVSDILDGSAQGSGSGSGEDDEEDPLELVHVDEDFYYMTHVMRLAALLHSIVSLAMLIAYYHLKVLSSKFFCNYRIYFIGTSGPSSYIQT